MRSTCRALGPAQENLAGTVNRASLRPEPALRMRLQVRWRQKGLHRSHLGLWPSLEWGRIQADPGGAQLPPQIMAQNGQGKSQELRLQGQTDSGFKSQLHILIGT